MCSWWLFRDYRPRLINAQLLSARSASPTISRNGKWWRS